MVGVSTVGDAAAPRTAARITGAEPGDLLHPGGPNPIAVANGVVADEWTLWIVLLAMITGVTRYNDWLRAGPISSSVLTARLTALVRVGVFRRTAYTARPLRFEYRLTRRGGQLWPVLVSIWAWERRWVHGTLAGTADEPDVLPNVRHERCGAIVEPGLICGACAAPTTARDVSARFGPAWTWQRSMPSASTRRRGSADQRPRFLLSQTMAVIGNRWSAALLMSTFLGATRFVEFEQQMGAPPTIVANRLRTFRELDFLVQAPHPERPDWTTYHLSEKGRAFFPVVAEAVEWGQRWFRSPEGTALELVHDLCGAAFHPVLVCTGCATQLRAAHLRVLGDDE